MNIVISNSVGEMAKNIPKDVKTIQTQLNIIIQGNKLKPLDLLVVDGIAGKNTKHAIKEFQRRIVGMASPDSRIDPRGRTIKKLESLIPEKLIAPMNSPIQISYNPALLMILGKKSSVANKLPNSLTISPSYPPGPTMELRLLTKENFVKKLHEGAIIEERRSKVPAGITTAQGILETGYGKHVPIDMETGKYSFNLFGIKGIGTAGSVNIYTHEEIAGKMIKIIDKFAAYNNFSEGLVGRTDFFRRNPRYAFLFESTDPVEWAYGLKKASYATDSKYPEKLISIMKSWKLI